ncbi:MAG TPA: (2Fe-2S) ferredoxin domain-containing protein [Planctomycetes bacterium]|nr:(2Fe-2S) ferredoxin domain-containing protein [Planctomycetota bacterium]HIN79730.1 (2Fe-2S) ferredoxin domain-containing protein [Planctomycetota bacterium]
MSSHPYQRIAWVCVEGKTCPRQGSRQLFDALRKAIHSAGATDRVRVARSGCLAQCGHGPHVVIEPGTTWYAPVTTADSRPIIEQLLEGTPAPDLEYQPPSPGKNIRKPAEETIIPLEDPS